MANVSEEARQGNPQSDNALRGAAPPKPGKAKARAVSASKNIALIAVLSAFVVGGKFALAWTIPNVEIVTVLLIVFTVTLGFFRGIAVAVIFCLLDMLLYTFSLSVAVAYFIYWPFLVCVAHLANHVKRGVKPSRSEYVNAFAAAVCSFLFGVVTTFTDMLITGAAFVPRYISGIVFFALHIVSNFLIVLFAFKPLSKLLFKLKTLYRF